MQARKLKVVVAGAIIGVIAAGVPAAQADQSLVCNEAENSHRGDNVVLVPDTRNPPARFTTDRMAVANGHVNAGVLNAADRSPVLAMCGPVDDGGSGGNGAGGGIN
ncbi:MAG: hypothetical protein QOK04_2588 [Solirubrobacteraceae bacterium]|jgi:hypothetical protein|nr:hypothetical protein [Solirubrobacteraceae bacterium]